jgi:hypothetical protein
MVRRLQGYAKLGCLIELGRTHRYPESKMRDFLTYIFVTSLGECRPGAVPPVHMGVGAGTKAIKCIATPSNLGVVENTVRSGRSFESA